MKRVTDAQAHAYAQEKFESLAKTFGPDGVPPMNVCMQLFEAYWELYRAEFRGSTLRDIRLAIVSFVNGLFAGWDVKTQLAKGN